MVRGGRGPSDTRQHNPAAPPNEKSKNNVKLVEPDVPGQLIEQLSDEFNAGTLGPQWSWVRPPDSSTYVLTGGTFRWDTQPADLYQDDNTASVLLELAPNGDYVTETKVTLNLPAEGCCYNFVQAGLVIYGDDNNYLRLMHVSIWETRQTEFAKEFIDPFSGQAHFGGTLVGPRAETTWLRIVKRTHAGEEHFTAYTSHDGQTWVRGGTWTHNLGNTARIGLLSLGGSGFVASFDYVRVYTVHHGQGGVDEQVDVEE